jgi:hypothetical protein
MVRSILQRWCRVFHKGITLPVNHQYTCLTCLKTYRVGW